MNPHPAMIFTNATFHTMRVEGETVEALAVRSGRIIGAGTRADCDGIAGPDADVIDLHGATVVPGLTDSHTHLISGALAMVHEINFDSTEFSTIGDVVEAVRARAALTPEGQWITGFQLRDEHLVERRYPTRHELDQATVRHPVMLTSSGSHVTVGNSVALDRAGIGSTTADPPGGSLDREPDGTPTGVLRERARLRLRRGGHDSVVPDYTDDQYVDALAGIAGYLLEGGVTCVGVMVQSGKEARAYQRAVEEGRFPVRVRMMYRVVESEMTIDDLDRAGIRNGLGDDRLRVVGIKMSVDGGSLQRNAAMYDAYPGEPHNHGLIRIESAELVATMRRAHALGLRSVVHAIGDKAYDMALNAFAEAVVGVGATDHRGRIEHLGNVPMSADQLAMAAELGIVASPQPAFLHVYGDKWAEIFGPVITERGCCQNRSLLDAGIPVIASSDFPMSPVDFRYGLSAATTRTTAGGQVLGPGEAISVYEALQMYTAVAAWADFEEDLRGTLALGKLADLAVLGQDPFRLPPDELLHIPVLMTVIGGHIAFSSLNAEPTTTTIAVGSAGARV